jgi:carbon-monoxide dehydrogenase large subunit
MPGSILGNAVVRVEDPDLLQGRATYIDNLHIDGLLHLAFVRSPFPHATISQIDTTEAAAAPGVVAVFVADDLGIPAHDTFLPVNAACKRPPLAQDKVRFVGDMVAVVVAETKAAAVDAVELVDVDYDPLPSVTDPELALAPDAPLQFEELGSNIAAGEREADETDVLADAEVVVRARIDNQRMAVVPMEGNAIVVIPAGGAPARGTEVTGDFETTIYVSTQMPHAFHSLAAKIFPDMPADTVRVIAPHVGGGFGGKAGLVAEHSVAIAAARKLGRPVKWVETRSENLIAMPHGRAQVQYVELGLKRDGTITGLRCRMIGDAGSYAGFGGVLPMQTTYAMAQGVYKIPKISYSAVAVLTNTTTVGAFRGAGRPEAAAFLERIMDIAAAELDIDPVELRRRNLLGSDIFPYTTVVGTTYDSGDYAAPLEKLLELADYPALRAEQAKRRANGDVRQLGLGLGVYVEVTSGGGGQEYGAVTIHDDGSATIAVGTSGHGQGHATSFSMLVSDALGIPMDKITFIQSDTALVPRGGGTGGSRSLQVGGNAVNLAAGAVLERARDIAATLLEANVDDVTVAEDGGLGVRGVPTATVSWSQLAAAALADGEPLAAALDFKQADGTFPFGAHLAVVEVDTETGYVKPLRHIAVDDCGRILNPLIVQGQQHGGMAQGIAQALWEQFVYDEDGNPQTSTLADYTIPTAADLPTLQTANTETPTPLNPLGAKGIGESATIGSTPAVQNAVVDAIAHLGVRHIDMPCTPQRVWAAIQAGPSADLWREPPAALADLPVRTSRASGGEAI